MQTRPAAGDSAKALVARFWGKVWNPPYSMETFDDIVADDFVISTDGARIEGKEAFRVWLQGFQSKIGRLRTTPEAILLDEGGTLVTTRMVVSGINNGLFGTTPDESPVEFVAISIMEVRDGKLAFNWVERSAFELYQRLSKSQTR